MVVAFVFALSLCLAAVASAQYGEPVKNPFGVKLGLFMPQEGDVRDVTSDTWFAAGLDYIFQETQMPAARASVSLEWSQHSIDGGGDARIIPLTANYSWKAKTTEESMSRFFYGLGAGLYFIRVKDNGDTSSETKFGAQIHAGVEFAESWYIELKYAFVSKVHGVNPGGFFAFVGKRF